MSQLQACQHSIPPVFEKPGELQKITQSKTILYHNILSERRNPKSLKSRGIN